MSSFEFLACAVGAGLQLVTCDRHRACATDTKSLGIREWGMFIVVTALLFVSLNLGNIALKYVSFPVKVVIKSSKLVPAMLIGVLLLSKRYTATHYCAALLLCGGVIGVTLSNDALVSSAPVSGVDSSLQTLGIAFLFLAVCADSVIPVVQEMLLRVWRVGQAEIMLGTNALGFLVEAAVWMQTNEVETLATLGEREGSAHLFSTLAIYGSTSFVGIAAMLMVISVWGSAVGVAVATLRKVVTVVISFIAYPKQFTWSFAVSGALVLASIVLTASPLARRDKE